MPSPGVGLVSVLVLHALSCVYNYMEVIKHVECIRIFVSLLLTALFSI